MKHSRALSTAVLALRRSKTRSLLTTLGIVVGVAAVIAMVEIGHGSASAIQKTIASMGSNILIIMPGQAASGGVSFGAGSVLTLTAEDATAIERECPAVLTASPIVRARSQVVAGNRNWVPMTIYGTGPGFFDARDWRDLDEGEAFADRDVRNGSKVVVIGRTIADQLFPGMSAVGKDLRIQNVSFRVTGVLRRKGANMMGMDQDDIILAPWTTIKSRVSAGTNQMAASTSQSSSTTSDSSTKNRTYPSTGAELYPEVSSTQAADLPQPRRFANIDEILVAARSGKDVDPAIEQITALLRQRHHLHSDEAEDFTIRDMAELSKAVTATTSMTTSLLLVVALISLLVGGVGIMNIMLVSVTERTREIGLRMAVGAQPWDILEQFLVEAVVLCLAGGVLGVALGRTASTLVTKFLHWPTEYSIPAILAAFLVSASVGVIFGFYPAWKASRLDPIEALRYE